MAHHFIADIIDPPRSVFTTFANSSEEMFCRVEAETINMLVNGENADQDALRNKGIFLGTIQSDGKFSSVSLTIIVEKELNNTMVQCVAINVVTDASSKTSAPVFFIIEGLLI